MSHVLCQEAAPAELERSSLFKFTSTAAPSSAKLTRLPPGSAPKSTPKPRPSQYKAIFQRWARISQLRFSRKMAAARAKNQTLPCPQLVAYLTNRNFLLELGAVAQNWSIV